MIKKSVLMVILWGAFTDALGQTIPHFTHYYFNQSYLNPGAVGIQKGAQIDFNIRKQYLGYESTENKGGQNTSGYWAFQTAIPKLNSGLGIVFSANQFSKLQSVQTFHLQYSFHRKVNQNILGIGTGIGITNFSIDGDNTITREPNDPVFPSTKANQIKPTFDMGVFLVNPNFEVGVSAVNLTKARFNFNNLPLGSERQFRIHGQYHYPITFRIDLHPTVLLQTDLHTYTPEIGLLTTFDNKYWLGATFRYEDAISGILGAKFLNQKLWLGYAGDFVYFGQDAKASSSHELFLRINLNQTFHGSKSIVRTPRYHIR